MKPDLAKFENPLQLGGIRTGTLDSPGAGGGQPVRVALFDTGAGLRFTVALDRGGDIVDASFKQHASPTSHRTASCRRVLRFTRARSGCAAGRAGW
jgi:hypothetical protein